MKKILAVASVCLLAASSAHAQANLVLNPGFETGDLTGWTIVDGATPTVVTSPVNSGSDAVELYRSDGGASMIYQNLTLAAAPTVITFWADSPSGGKLSVVLDNAMGGLITLPSSAGYVEYTYTGNVPAGSEQLSFSFTPGYSQKVLYLDDISVTQVPEPTTMIGGALLLLPFGASTLRILRKNRGA